MGSIPRRCVACAVALMLVMALSQSATMNTNRRPILAPSARATSLPDDLLPTLNATLGAHDPAYRVLAAPATPALLAAVNPRQQFRTTFAADGVHFDGGNWGLRLDAIGDDTVQRPVAVASPIAVGNRVEYRRGAVTEWYVNGPAGVEQGFTLAAPPSGGNSDVLTLRVAVTGAGVTAAGDGLLLTSQDGAVLRYGHLTVRDATGRALAARLEVDGEAISIAVAAAGAVYPVVVDPLVQGARLTGSGEVGQGVFGSSVALSGDGNTAVVGAQNDNSGVGAAYVFTRGGATWSQQQLTGTGEVGQGGFGFSVALSADGNTALIGAAFEMLTFSNGAAYVFTRSGTTWTQQQRLTPAGSNNFGWSAALSADGTTALIGAVTDGSPHIGAAYVFTRSGTTWSQQQRLTGTGEVGAGQFGQSAALSADGNTALVGAYQDNSAVGAAYVFVRGGGVWTQQQRLTGTGEVGAGQFGQSAALSADGNTALIGANFDNSNIGAAYVFVRSGVTWTQQQQLTGTGEVGSGRFGQSAALSGDGTTALVGALSENGNVGAAYVFPLRYTLTTLVGTTPQSAAVGAAFPIPPAVRVLDQAGGQPVVGATVSFAAPTAGASGTFTGGMTTTTATTDANGVATAPTFTANATAGNYGVTATAVDGSSTVFELTNTPAGAAHITATFGGGQSATVGTAFATSLVARVQDAHGNPVTGISVTFAAPGSGASGTFTGSATVTTDSNGYATAPTFTANTTAGAYTVTATASGVTTPASFALTNTPGPVASLAVAGFPASTVAGTAYPFTVTAKDASGNIVTGYTGTVHLTSNDGAAALPADYTFTTGDQGVHPFAATLNTVGSGRTISATDSGHSVSGAETAIAVTPAVLTVSPMNGPQAGGGTVTITGIGMTGATNVTLGGAACTNVQVNGDGTILTCTAPTNQPAGTVDVAVTTPNGTGTLTHGYTFLPASVAPAPGGRGGASGAGGSPAALPNGR